MNVETFEAEYRTRIEAAQTDGDRLAIATDLLREATAQSARSMALATEAQAQARRAQAMADHAIEVCDRLAAEVQRITDAMKTSVAFIADDEEVLRFQLDMDPNRIMALLLRAVEECRSLVLADTLASRTVQ